MQLHRSLCVWHILQIDVHHVGTTLWSFANTETKEGFVHTMLSQVSAARKLPPRPTASGSCVHLKNPSAQHHT